MTTLEDTNYRINELGLANSSARLLLTHGGRTMNLRQIHDITCDRLATQLVTGERGYKKAMHSH